MTKRVIEGCYARLLGIRETILETANLLPRLVAQDYGSILSSLRTELGDEFDYFDISGAEFFFTDKDGGVFLRGFQFRLRLNQLIKYLETVHQASSRIVQIGSIYNAIKDKELKERCGDLLSAADHFDRVINQATQVLEERVRQKVPTIGAMTGMVLFGKAINPEPSKSMIVFSSNASEQEGYANLFKGLMGTFRNQTHHKFLENVTREQALQICAFIDNMLSALETAQVANPGAP